MSIELEKMF
jgi:dynein heavy chain